MLFIVLKVKKIEEPVAVDIVDNSGSEMKMTPVKQEADLIGTPLECPFDLDVLKIQDEEFYSRESMESHYKAELKSCPYKPFSSFEARYDANFTNLYVHHSKTLTLIFVFIFNRGILSKFILDPELLSPLPVFCLCDAEDGEKTSILGIEKTKRKELTNYKINVDGPVASSNPSIQFDKLKKEMSFLIQNGEVCVQFVHF